MSYACPGCGNEIPIREMFKGEIEDSEILEAFKSWYRRTWKYNDPESHIWDELEPLLFRGLSRRAIK